MLDNTVLIMEIIGTVAFAVSGSIIAASCGLDLLGIIIVGCITAVCGGMLRDVFLGCIPPAIFLNPALLLIAAVVSLLVFLLSYLNSEKFELLEKKIESINITFDAIGLAVFSVIGIEATFQKGFGDNALLAISMGVITGVGGGITRDVLVRKIPYVLKKHIYALASIIGSIIYYYISIHINRPAAILTAVPVIIAIRLLAAHFRWKLPRIRKNNEEQP